ncbi:MAG: hypothetical protein POG24_07130, partial [Acidocella sp.]|nr:hypothetical protein [Acidocella sp.]
MPIQQQPIYQRRIPTALRTTTRSGVYRGGANGAVREQAMTAIDIANQEQLKASNPKISAFVAASAG